MPLCWQTSVARSICASASRSSWSCYALVCIWLRAVAIPGWQASCSACICIPGDARQIAATRLQDVDVIYLDPMFPPRTKSAAVKKEMALFQMLLEHSADPQDADALLQWALRQDAARVVVKRPAKAPHAGGAWRRPTASAASRCAMMFTCSANWVDPRRHFQRTVEACASGQVQQGQGEYMSERKVIALVTGASAGLGAEFCRQLAPRCDVIIAVARRSERLGCTGQRIGRCR